MNSFEKITREEETKKETYKKKFIELRDNFRNDIPEKILELNDEDYHKYKCRGNFWNGVLGLIDNAIYEGVIQGEEKKKRAKSFCDVVGEHDFSKNTTKEDIDEINRIINEMIEMLS